MADIVIVDPSGAEHHFPEGFDPVRAAGIVRQSLAPPAPARPVGAGGRGTGLDVRQFDEAASGYGSTIPFSGVERPDTWRGTAGAAVGRATQLAYPAARIASAVMGAGGLVSGAAEAAAQLTPVLKYEATKATLEHLGVPAPIAIPLAMAVSGYKRGAKPTGTPRAATTAAEGEAVAAAAPPASPPAAPMPAAGPDVPRSVPAPPAGSGWSPQRIQNELGLAARRSKVTLTEEEYAAAAEQVAKGHAPAGVVSQLKAMKAAQAPPKLRLDSEESKVYTQLRRTGKTHQEAAQAIEQLRALATKLGTPASAAVRSQVADRNATGRWTPP